ncbi:MAG: hypothetical protein AUJ51_11105 [Elusimicrobia bacterium CG1_02_56_21]|nr:MAG: hypothetical protein AUJ51_11105 [Elusimicrobia bacterium CG1_02_56_21]
MRKQRVWLVTPFSPLPGEGCGGVKTHSELLARLLVKLGTELTVIVPEGGSKPGPAQAGFIIENVPSNEQPDKKNWRKAMRLTAKRLCRTTPPDIVFSQGYYAAGCEPVLRVNGAAIAAFVHNFHLIHFYKFVSEVAGPRSFASYLARSLPTLTCKMLFTEIPFLREAQEVISVSEHNARLLRRYYRIPGAVLSVLHNWVDTEVFTPSRELREEERKKLALTAGQTVFFAAGSLWRPKGFHVAIKAFKLLAERAPGTVLMLAGSGPEESALKTLAGPALISCGRVKFLGERALEELPSVYNAADVFLMPSIHPEGLAYTLIEAMACGLPPITTTLGGNTETVGDAGILLPHNRPAELASAMLDLASDPGKRSALGLLARERARRMFSEDQAAEKIKNLLGRHPGGGRFSA